MKCFLSRLDVVKPLLLRLGSSMETERLINSVSVGVEDIISKVLTNVTRNNHIALMIRFVFYNITFLKPVWEEVCVLLV